MAIKFPLDTVPRTYTCTNQKPLGSTETQISIAITVNGNNLWAAILADISYGVDEAEDIPLSLS